MTNYGLEPRALVNRGAAPFPTLDFDGFSASPGYTGRHIRLDPDNTRTVTLLLIPPTPSQWAQSQRYSLDHVSVLSLPLAFSNPQETTDVPTGDVLSFQASLFLDSVVRVRAPAGIFRPSILGGLR
jgi:hypothetical protein